MLLAHKLRIKLNILSIYNDNNTAGKLASTPSPLPLMTSVAGDKGRSTTSITTLELSSVKLTMWVSAMSVERVTVQDSTDMVERNEEEGGSGGWVWLEEVELVLAMLVAEVLCVTPEVHKEKI